MHSLRNDFLLDQDVVFLNHGSFGACPRPVFESYQHWQYELERQPVAFIGRRVRPLLAASRAALGAYLGAAPDELVYFPNPTTALNVVVRSLVLGEQAPIQAGNEVLSTDHEYGAIDRTWRFCCRRTGVRYVKQPIPLPVGAPADLVVGLWGGVN
jgi:isopenicillin-N epimerase